MIKGMPGMKLRVKTPDLSPVGAIGAKTTVIVHVAPLLSEPMQVLPPGAMLKLPAEVVAMSPLSVAPEAGLLMTTVAERVWPTAAPSKVMLAGYADGDAAGTPFPVTARATVPPGDAAICTTALLDP